MKSRCAKLLLTALLAAIVSAVAFIPAMADSGVAFSVTLPTSLPVTVDSSGNVTVSSDAKIINNGIGAVTVDSVSIQPLYSWSLSPWGTPFKTVGEKRFTMKLFNKAVPTSGTVDVSGLQAIGAGSSMAIPYDVTVSPQKDNGNHWIANAVFTVSWSGHGPLASIAVTSPPSKTAYYAGYPFDSTGMVVTATYADGTKAVVSGWTVSGGNSLSEGQNSVSVFYTEDGVTRLTTAAITVSPITYSLSAAVRDSGCIAVGSELTAALLDTAILGSDGSEISIRKLSGSAYLWTDTSQAVTACSPGWPANYENGTAETVCGEWTFEGAESIVVAFDEDSATESPTNYDYVTIYNKDGLVTGIGNSGKLGGKAGASNNNIAGKSFVIDGSYVKITFRSDNIVNDKGFFAVVMPNYATALICSPAYAPSTAGSFNVSLSLNTANQAIYGNLTAKVTLTAYKPEPCALLYDTDADGTGDELVFQYDDKAQLSKTLIATYTGFELASYSSGGAPWYAKRAGITRVTFKDRIAPVSTACWFKNFTKLATVQGAEKLDTSKATSMYEMFDGASSLEALDVSSWNTSAATEMAYMFHGCSALKKLDLSSFDTSHVENLAAMFSGCSSLTEVNLSSFTVSPDVRTMSSMFNNCKSLKELDLRTFDTADVTMMAYIFYGCSSLKTIYVSDNFKTAGLTVSASMFTNCTSLAGGSGTAYSSSANTKDYAVIDMPGRPGYFTLPVGMSMEWGTILKSGTVLSTSHDGTYSKIPAYTGSAALTFGDSDGVNDIRWIKVSDNMMVAERNLLRSISWDSIDKCGFAYGSTITINGGSYTVRLMTGGASSSATASSEWDKYIVNGPAGADNDTWHWSGCYSWCQETYSTSNRVLRGSSSASYWRNVSYTSVSVYYCFRPVLVWGSAAAASVSSMAASQMQDAGLAAEALILENIELAVEKEAVPADSVAYDETVTDVTYSEGIDIDGDATGETATETAYEEDADAGAGGEVILDDSLIPVFPVISSG